MRMGDIPQPAGESAGRRDDASVKIPKFMFRRLATERGCRKPNLGYNPAMPPAPGATKAVGMVPDEMKWEPKSKGLATPRKKKPKELAVITTYFTPLPLPPPRLANF